MITKSEPVSRFVAAYETCGLKLGIYKTLDGKRYAVRCFDPEILGENGLPLGLSFVASFSSKVELAKRPSSKDAQQKAVEQLYTILHDVKAGARYAVHHCVIDAETLANFPQYTEEDLGREFISIGISGSAEADGVFDKASASQKTVDAD